MATYRYWSVSAGGVRPRVAAASYMPHSCAVEDRDVGKRARREEKVGEVVDTAVGVGEVKAHAASRPAVRIFTWGPKE
jgi:hypothetical protein